MFEDGWSWCLVKVLGKILIVVPREVAKAIFLRQSYVWVQNVRLVVLTILMLVKLILLGFISN